MEHGAQASQDHYYILLTLNAPIATKVVCFSRLLKCLNVYFFLGALRVKIEPLHKISNNVVYATSKASDQPAHTRSLIIAFACRLNML